ncbi:MAG: flippase [Acidimicrobiales bacterium]
MTDTPSLLPPPAAPFDSDLEGADRPSIFRLVLRSSLTVVLVTVVQKLLALLLFRALALHYGPSQFGHWNTALAFVALFSVITDSGIDAIVVREASARRSDLDRFVSTAVIAKMGLAVVAIALCASIAAVMPYPSGVKVLIVLSALPLMLSFNSVYADVLQARLKIGHVKMVGLTVSVLTTAGGFAVIWAGWALTSLAVVNFVLALPSVILYQRMAGAFVGARLTFDRRVASELLSESLPLAFSGMFGVIYYRLDTILLSVLGRSEAVGYYASAYKISEALNILPGALMISVFPLMSRYARNPVFQARLRVLYHTTFKYVLVVIAPVVITICVLAEHIVLIVYSPAYLPAVAALRWIIWAEIGMFLSPVVYHLLIASGRQRLLIAGAASMAVLNLALNLVLLPRFGAVGAAAATTLTELLGLAIGLVLVRRLTGIRMPSNLSPVLVSLLPFSALVLVARGLPGAALPVVLAAACAGYTGLLFATGGLRMAELRALVVRS